MKCPACKKITEDSNTFMRGYCDECDVKRRTCTGCGALVEAAGVFVAVNSGVETGRGHLACFVGISKGGTNMFNKEIGSKEELLKTIEALELLEKGYVISTIKRVSSDKDFPWSFTIWKVIECEVVIEPTPHPSKQKE